MISIFGFLFFLGPVMNDVTPDTLDWQRYFPLEVGNIWEYEASEGPPLWRREIIGETTVNGIDYFIIAELNGRRQQHDTVYARYHEAGTVLEFFDLAADTSGSPYHHYYAGHGYYGLFDLNAGFKEIRPYRSEVDRAYYVEGGYEIAVTLADTTVTADAVKEFYLGDEHAADFYWREIYVADVGFVEGGSLQYATLTYARVGGKEYGTMRYTSTEPAERPETRVPALSLYPQPAAGFVTIELIPTGPAPVTVEVFDLLGRPVSSHHFPPFSEHPRLDISGLAPGTYAIRARQDFEPIGGGLLVVTRN